MQSVDETGLTGALFNYVLFFLFLGGAFFAFLYFWWKGRLDMDEEPKNQMMEDDDD